MGGGEPTRYPEMVPVFRDFLAASGGLPERVLFVSFSAADHDVMGLALAESG